MGEAFMFAVVMSTLFICFGAGVGWLFFREPGAAVGGLLAAVSIIPLARVISKPRG